MAGLVVRNLGGEAAGDQPTGAKAARLAGTACACHRGRSSVGGNGEPVTIAPFVQFRRQEFSIDDVDFTPQTTHARPQEDPQFVGTDAACPLQLPVHVREAS